MTINVGWDYDCVLPLFKKLENWEGGANDFRGAGGPMRADGQAGNLTGQPD